MAISLKVDNEAMMLAEIERVRGNLTPGEFIVRCISDGVRRADLERHRKASAGKPGMLNLGQVKSEFGKVDRDTVAQAVTVGRARKKEAEESNPIYGEVERLVEKYESLLMARKRDTGGRPIANIDGIALAPIQQFALELALQSVQKENSGTVRTVTKH